jgi:pimeloyl-ACP methyl ester carboxylesterase
MSTWVGSFAAPGIIAETLESMLGPDAGKAPPDFVSYRQQLWNNPRSLAVNARQGTTDVEGLTAIAARLPEVAIPTVVIGCAQDPTEGHSVDSRRLAKELPGSEIVWLEGCGHYVQYGRPEAVIDAVRKQSAPTSAPE